jgi:hypothetical protein
MSSRRHGNSQFWLHVRCVQSAFAGSRFDVDAEDMSVDLEVAPDSEGWAEMPDEEPPAK